jgi:diketogulonate reductase-like aldo/keto reductase
MTHSSHEPGRRAFLAAAGAVGLAAGIGFAPALALPAPILRRTIPRTGEALPVIGMGTWITFNVGKDAALRAGRARVLETFLARGGAMVDSSPMYGSSEEVIGHCLAQIDSKEALFAATKVWTPLQWLGVRQMEESERLWGTKRFDLMQVHNLLDWETHMATLRSWTQDGRFRYLGVTHYTASAYDELEAVMRKERLDFVQLNYSLDDRSAERRLLPLAADRGIAILVNVPFGGGGLLRRLGSRPLPDWAAEIDCTSWAQILLKFVLAQPAVTCVIPGTGNPAHMADNCRAGSGTLPDAALRRRIIAEWEAGQ